MYLSLVALLPTVSTLLCAPPSIIHQRQAQTTTTTTTLFSMAAEQQQQPRRKIQAILFDLDGTLLDTETLSDRAIVKAFGKSLPEAIRAEQSQQLDWEAKKQLLGKRGEDWTPIMLQYAATHWGVRLTDSDDNDTALPTAPSPADFFTQWEGHLNDMCESVQECAGAAALVSQLAKAGIPLAIATSSRLASVQKKRKHHGAIFGPMKAIVTGDHPAVHTGKPAPDIYLEAARQLGVDPEACLVFEDALTGVKSGKAAGCAVVAVPDPRMERSVYEGLADVILDSLVNFDGAEWGLEL